MSTVLTGSVIATVIGAAGPVDGAFQLYTPQGTLFQSQVVHLTGTAFDSQVIQFDFPVAGTTIDQSQLSGQWRAQFSLGGSALATASFRLDP